MLTWKYLQGTWIPLTHADTYPVTTVLAKNPLLESERRIMGGKKRTIHLTSLNESLTEKPSWTSVTVSLLNVYHWIFLSYFVILI